MEFRRRRFLRLTAAAVAGLSASPLAWAQDYPTRAVTIVVPFTPGGSTDIIARMLAQRLEQRLGKSFVVENRPGAGTIIGATAVAKTAPDGYVLLMAPSSTMAVNVTLYKKLPYDPPTDFIPLAGLARVPFVLLVNPSLPVHSLLELIAYAKARPGQLSFASVGPGVPHHLYAELLMSTAGIAMTHVPYKGTHDIVAKLHAELLDILALPEIETEILRLGMLPFENRSVIRQVGDCALEQGRAASRDRGIGIVRFCGPRLATTAAPARDHWHRSPHSLTSAPRARGNTNNKTRNAVKRSDMLVIGLLAAAMSASAPAPAQDRYPLRPVRLVIPSVPAGVHDVIGRVWAERVKPQFGAIVIDNRGGGAGSIGANDVAHSPPDGYSILLGSTTTHVLVPPVMANPPYDPVKDFSAVTVFAYSSTSIVVNPSLSVHTLAELIAYAKANPGKLSYGSAGTGSITHIAGEYFKQLAGGLEIVTVPYKGIGQAVTDVIGGQIPMLSANATAQILDLHRAGKVRILSVNSQTRIRGAPDLPTSMEAGLPGMVAQTTFGIFAPAGTPEPILARINAVTQQALADGEFQTELVRLGFEPVRDVGPATAAGVFQDELARWTPILKAVGGKPE